MSKIRVLFCGTHPEQFNGYSKVVYELSSEIVKYDDIEWFIYGFQNFYENADHKKERVLPSSAIIYDASPTFSMHPHDMVLSIEM